LGRLKEKYISKAGSSDYAAASPMMRKVLTRVVNEDYTSVLHKIKQSTLLVWGDADSATPIAHGQMCERLMPDAGLVTLNGGTHYAILEQAHVFLRILGVFLK
jgi:pimeloyl-ACP methyl ester carboxylesterase